MHKSYNPIEFISSKSLQKQNIFIEILYSSRYKAKKWVSSKSQRLRNITSQILVASIKRRKRFNYLQLFQNNSGQSY